MASWDLKCKNCGENFTHQKLADTLQNYFLPERPQFPSGGKSIECPHCGTEAMYMADELSYMQ